MSMNPMNEVVPGLWIGDLASALNSEKLREHNIHSVLTAMRGRVRINETCNKLQINLDDTEDADVLSHLVAAIQFIEAELEKGRGVLVHCQAGLSRSATIVAAYLMYVQHIDYEAALDLIRGVRPNIQPNDGFLRQLAVFQEASYRVSRRDKATRMYYLERVVEEVMNGEGSFDTDFFAKFPRTPTDSAPATPGGPRRRIRCKMCRQELAAREHMLDHGQVGPTTPAFTPVASRRPSSSLHDAPVRPFAPLTPVKSPPSSRRPSMNDSRPAISSPLSPTGSRRPSMNDGSARPVGLAALTPMTPISTPGPAPMSRRPSGSNYEPQTRSRLGSNVDTRPLKSSLLALQGAAQFGQDISDELSESAVEGSDDEEEEAPNPPNTAFPRPETDGDAWADPPSAATSPTAASNPSSTSRDLNVKSLSLGGSMPSPPALSTSPSASSAEPLRAIPPSLARQFSSSSGTPLMHGSDLAAQLSNNPKLAGLRSPTSGLNMTAMTPSSPGAGASANGASPVGRGGSALNISPPLLANNTCSGYFVEPMKWMDAFLQEGQMAGKIVCPNKKCGAKLGNYDWAGVCCSCKQWVVPGFCIHRSKVDEVVV
ncbi:uncharacterized protein C8Q71DRAFT_192483 [Rhodofomes roseus]|uniref:protein-tyrosine-phosphatase n=1 Tax=Rhodofomes roseus TaxID=34475 RepID=A0ABQ8K7C9_9APHY|nr:uncharacterized protein C8Q71DRAFT_192483 [Rhodofomes roseus]KAH9833166.1 hypothetical protein C8Q71DRAFT_192483 [Rhodofomes roseus]